MSREVAQIAAAIIAGGAVVALVVWWMARRRRGSGSGESWVALESVIGIDGVAGEASEEPRAAELEAIDEIAALIDARGRIVALSDAARGVFDRETGCRYADLGRMRPVARAAGFDQSEHPVALVLRGASAASTCCAVETRAGLFVGELAVQATKVGDEPMALMLFRPAVASAEAPDRPVTSGA